jgi:hypothetical protein
MPSRTSVASTFRDSRVMPANESVHEAGGLGSRFGRACVPRVAKAASIHLRIAAAILAIEL